MHPRTLSRADLVTLSIACKRCNGLIQRLPRVRNEKVNGAQDVTPVLLAYQSAYQHHQPTRHYNGLERDEPRSGGRPADLPSVTDTEEVHWFETMSQ
jgi:hypothetical protein